MFTRENISLIVFLLDIRHKPTENDRLMLNYILGTNLPFIILANKADKIAVTKVQNSVDTLKEELCLNDNISILPFSSERKIYTENVWNILYNYIINVN